MRTSCAGRRSRSITRFSRCGVAGRLFVHASGDPYALVPPVTRVIREMSANQPVERAATLEDVRAEVLAPERLNAFVVLRIRRHRPADCRGRCRRRAGVLGERAHARIRGAAGRRLDAASPACARAVGRRADRRRSGSPPAPRAATRSRAWRRAISRTCGCPARCRSWVRPLSSPAPPSLASLMPAARASRVDVLQALRSE